MQAKDINLIDLGYVILVAANVKAVNKATIAANGVVTIVSGEKRPMHEWGTTYKE